MWEFIDRVNRNNDKTPMFLIYPRQSNDAHAPRLSPVYKSTVNRSPTKPLVIIPHTLSELTGPVYGHETVREHDHDLTIQLMIGGALPTRRIRACFRTRPSRASDVAAPMQMAGFPSIPSSWALCLDPGESRRPSISCSRSSRGMTQQAITRIYFHDDSANATDPILALVLLDRLRTLIARREPGNVAIYRFDVHLQGDNETVFFDL